MNRNYPWPTTTTALLAALLLSLFVSHNYAEESGEEVAESENAATETAAEPSPTLSETANQKRQRRQQQLEAAASEQEKVWLDAGADKILALYQAEHSGVANGGLLIIPNISPPPTAHSLINSLRHSLPANKWHTLTLYNSEHQTSEQTLAAIASAIAYLNQQGVYNLAILGEGSGAAQALLYAASLPAPRAQQKFQQLRAVLMIDAENQLDDSELDPLAAMKGLSMPILDAVSDQKNRLQQQAQLRRQQGRAMTEGQYQQIRLPAHLDYHNSLRNRSTQRLRGWLNKNIAGITVDR